MYEEQDYPVIVGVDLTESSRRALVWGRDLAYEIERPLLVVRAWEPPQRLLDGEDTAWRSAMHGAVLRETAQWVDTTLGRRDGPVEAVMGPVGPVLAALSGNATAVVVGGGALPSPHDARSVGWYCTHYCHAPVYVIPSRGPVVVQPRSRRLIDLDDQGQRPSGDALVDDTLLTTS